MNPKIVETVFPGTMKKINEGKCPVCSQKIGEFRDSLSRKEYQISGMCQECQDSVFG